MEPPRGIGGLTHPQPAASHSVRALQVALLPASVVQESHEGGATGQQDKAASGEHHQGRRGQQHVGVCDVIVGGDKGEEMRFCSE